MLLYPIFCKDTYTDMVYVLIEAFRYLWNMFLVGHQY